MDDTSPGNVPNPDGIIAEEEYKDESIHVTIKRLSRGALHCIAAYVKIEDPSQIRTAMSADDYDKARVMPVKVLAKKYNPILTSSGDFFKGNDYGYLVRQSKVYRERPDGTRDVLLIDNFGDFHVLTKPSMDDINAFLATLKEGQSIVNTFNFGPIFVKDGEKVEITSTLDSANYQHMRVAIAQLGPLEYVIFQCEGKATGNFGMTTKTFQKWIMEIEPRIQTAYNLDGGGSGHVLFMDKELLRNPNPRYIYDIIYFASASDSFGGN